MLGWLTWANYRRDQLPFWQWAGLAAFVLLCGPTVTMNIHPGQATNERFLFLGLVAAMMLLHIGVAVAVWIQKMSSSVRLGRETLN